MSEQFHPTMRELRRQRIHLVGTEDRRWWGETEADRGWLRTYFGQAWLADGLTPDGRWQRQRLDNLGFVLTIRSARPGERFGEAENHCQGCGCVVPNGARYCGGGKCINMKREHD